MAPASHLHLCMSLCLVALVLPTFVAGFGSGEVSTKSNLYGYAARHGDIENLLIALPMSYATNTLFGAKNAKRVYFGNWLRDFSQIIDTGALTHIPEALLHIIIAIFGLLQFGYATREYEITADILGSYRPEEHIDNPRGYPDDAQKLSSRLRGPVKQKELEVDPRTGMKNYIANENMGINTSSAYIRSQLGKAINLGRERNNEQGKIQAMRHLGAGLHTLEDFAAHSNYIELCLRLLGEQDSRYTSLKKVFPKVGENAVVQTKQGPAPPLVTGTFGPLDAFESILGEIADQQAGGKLGDLGFLDDRIGDSGNQGLLAGLFSLAIPGELRDKVKQLQQFKPSEGGSDALDFQTIIEDPDALWQQIKPFVELHDDIRGYIDGLDFISEDFRKALFAVSNAVDTFLFQQLSPILKPIIKDIRQYLEKEREALLAKEKQQASDSEADVLRSGSTATNPTHTMLAKDHFDSILNNPAGQVAAVITSFTTRTVVSCWDNPSIDAENAIRNILIALHHPFNSSPTSELQQSMFKCVKDWWNFKDDLQRTRLLRVLTTEGVQNGVKLRINRPSDYFLKPIGPGKMDKPILEVLADNITRAQEEGTIKMSKQTLETVVETLQQPPTPAQPNPVDAALAVVAMPLADLFRGVGLTDIMAVPTMGEMVKSTVIDGLIRVPGFGPE